MRDILRDVSGSFRETFERHFEGHSRDILRVFERYLRNILKDIRGTFEEHFEVHFEGNFRDIQVDLKVILEGY